MTSLSKKYLKLLIRVVLSIILIVTIYILTLLFPQFLFSYSITKKNLTIYSDTPIPEQFNICMKQVMRRINRSAFYDSTDTYRVFICNSKWRFYYFATIKYNTGGINYSFLNRNSFIRPSDMSHNRLYSPSTGLPISGDRTLTYFISHEVAHGMTGAKIGRWRLWKEPLWKVEGYADYIGKGVTNFDSYLKKFKNHDREMDWKTSGLYCEFHLMVAYLLDKKDISQKELFYKDINEGQIRQELYQLKSTPDKVIHERYFASAYR